MSRTSARAIVAVLLLYSVSGCSGGEYVGPAGHPTTASSGTPSTPSPVTPAPVVSGAPAPTATPMPNATPTPHATATPIPTTPPTPAPTPTLGTSLYVVDSAAEAIYVFPLAANGNVAPTYSIAGTQSGLKFPVAAAFDSSGNLYSANAMYYNQPGNVVTYAPPFSSTSTPASTLSYSGIVNPVDIAIDAVGNIYLLNEVTNNNNFEYSIFVFKAGASGNATPLRTISLSITGDVTSMAVDSTTIYLTDDQDNQVYELPINSTGSVTPSFLGGSATGLDGPAGVRVDYQDHVVVRNQNNATISRFAPATTGNVVPLSTINISAFAMGEDAQSLCLDGGGNVFTPHDDTANSMAANAKAIGYFPISDTGTVSPARILSGSMTNFDFVFACAVR